MGRRALPKIDPSVDLSPILYSTEELPCPFNAAELFQREAPLQIEVGSGKGLFLQTAGRNQPDHNFLGVEVSKKFARFAAYRCAKQGLGNVRVLSGDALRFFAQSAADACADDVHVYFPDPWWKARHRRRRVMNEGFVQDIQRVLKQGGTLHFWTDVLEYYETTCTLIADVSSLEGPLPVTELPAAHDLDYRTHFERRTRLNDLPVYRSRFLKQK